MTEQIRQILRDHARLAVPVDTLADGDDLHEAGMTSQASVGVMLALEEAFDVEFPDRMLRRRTFESVDAIQAAVREVAGARAGAHA